MGLDLALGPELWQMGWELGEGRGAGALAQRFVCIVMVGKTWSSVQVALAISLPESMLCLRVPLPLFCALHVRGQMSRVHHGPGVTRERRGAVCRRPSLRGLGVAEAVLPNRLPLSGAITEGLAFTP